MVLGCSLLPPLRFSQSSGLGGRTGAPRRGVRWFAPRSSWAPIPVRESLTAWVPRLRLPRSSWVHLVHESLTAWVPRSRLHFREPEVVLGLPWLLARYRFDLDLSKYRQRPPYCQLWTTEHGVLHRSKYISASWICFHLAFPSRPSARERRLVRGLLRNDHTVFTLVTLSGYLSGRILMRSMPQGMPHDNDVWAETRWLLGPFCTGRYMYGCTCTCTEYSRLVRRDVFAFEPSIGYSRRGTLPWPLRRRVHS